MAAEGNDLAKKQIWQMVGIGVGCLLLGAVLGTYVAAPIMEKQKAKKKAAASKTPAKK